MKVELAKETANYDTEIKAYQFEPEVYVIKKMVVLRKEQVQTRN